jgi:hypothetical protein
MASRGRLAVTIRNYSLPARFVIESDAHMLGQVYCNATDASEQTEYLRGGRQLPIICFLDANQM